MKLISCYIENFGKIHDYSVDFTSGANIVCEENGWGKSTFAAFIRAMFYGLDGDRKRSIEESERKRYKPWQGGIFGGQLIFEINDRKYQILRIFHAKDAEDEFELRDVKTNLPSKDYSKNIGEEIFKINRESFIRTIFICQSDCAAAVTDDINAKIGNLADNSNDLNNYDSACTKLTEIMNSLNPKRATGSIAKRRDDIANCERIVQEEQNVLNSMNIYQERLHAEEETYNSLKYQIQKAGELQSKVSKIQSVLAKKTEWDRLRKYASDKKNEQDLIRQKFPKDVPDIETVRKQISICNDMASASERVSLSQMTDNENAELSELETVFMTEFPNDADIDKKIQEAARLRDLEQELVKEQLSAAERLRLEELDMRFSEETESVASVSGKWNKRNNKKAALTSNQSALTALKASYAAQKAPASKLSPLLIIGIAILVLGIIAAASISLIPGIIAAIIGAAVSVTGVIKNKNSASSPAEAPDEIKNLQRIIDEDISFIEKTDAEVTEYLSIHGRIFDEDTASTILQEITAESFEYNTLKKKADKASGSGTISDINSLQQSITAYLARFGASTAEKSFTEHLYDLKGRAGRYSTLKDKKNNFRQAEIDYKAGLHEITAFLDKYGYAQESNIPSHLNDIRDAVHDYEEASKTYTSAVCELREFERENDTAQFAGLQTEESLPSLEEINQHMQRITDERDEAHSRIVACNKTLEELQYKYDECEEYRSKLAVLKETQDTEQKKYNYVSKAKAILTRAKEEMTSKYTAPILKSFCKYYEMITGSEADKFHLDANAEITVDEYGKQRDIITLSSGRKDLIGICLRIALVDAMYQEETPVLIMDDPFTNLDDNKAAAGVDFIQKLAEKYQIIYFTCSKSRS